MPRRTATRLLLLVAALSAVNGCGAPKHLPPEGEASPVAPTEVQAAGLSVRLIDTVTAKDERALVKDPGWLEYRLEIRNLGREPVTILNVKLLTFQGRYLDSASNDDEIMSPPDSGADVGGEIARRGAGIAAGQVIPYGGAIVGILSSAIMSASSQDSAETRHERFMRRIKDVELAPGGSFNGSAFLPRTQDAQALALNCERDKHTTQVVLPLK